MAFSHLSKDEISATTWPRVARASMHVFCDPHSGLVLQLSSKRLNYTEKFSVVTFNGSLLFPSKVRRHPGPQLDAKTPGSRR